LLNNINRYIMIHYLSLEDKNLAVKNYD
jgi:hypothetical protein